MADAPVAGTRRRSLSEYEEDSPTQVDPSATKRSRHLKPGVCHVVSNCKQVVHSVQGITQAGLRRASSAPVAGRPDMSASYTGRPDEMEDLQHWRMREQTQRQPSAEAIGAVQREVTVQMRWMLVDWLGEVRDEFHLSSETLLLAVRYIDRYLCKVPVSRSRFQLLGVSCLWVAAKYEEVMAPTAMSLVGMTADHYSIDDMKDMERDVLFQLDFELAGPTSLRFLHYYLLLTPLPQTPGAGLCVRRLAEALLELTALDAAYLRAPPSVQAAASLYLALGLCQYHASLPCLVSVARCEPLLLGSVVKDLMTTLTMLREAKLQDPNHHTALMAKYEAWQHKYEADSMARAAAAAAAAAAEQQQQQAAAAAAAVAATAAATARQAQSDTAMAEAGDNAACCSSSFELSASECPSGQMNNMNHAEQPQQPHQTQQRNSASQHQQQQQQRATADAWDDSDEHDDACGDLLACNDGSLSDDEDCMMAAMRGSNASSSSAHQSSTMPAGACAPTGPSSSNMNNHHHHSNHLHGNHHHSSHPHNNRLHSGSGRNDDDRLLFENDEAGRLIQATLNSALALALSSDECNGGLHDEDDGDADQPMLPASSLPAARPAVPPRMHALAAAAAPYQQRMQHNVPQHQQHRGGGGYLGAGGAARCS